MPVEAKTAIDHLSVSQINMFLRCPKQYEFRYIKGIKAPPSGAMIQGTAYHHAVAQDLISKRDAGTLLSESDLIDAFASSFESKLKSKEIDDEEGEAWEFEDIEWDEQHPDKVKDEGIRLALMYHRQKAGTLAPTEVERRQEITIAGYRFILIADVVEEGRIIDHKVRKRRQSESDIAQDLQSIVYSMFYPGKAFEWHNVLRLKTPVIEVTGTTRTQKDFNRFTALAEQVGTAIQSGIFYPSPIGWHCSEKWCGYWNECQGRYK